MVITLGAVGSVFLIYFFNENSTPLFDTPLKSIYVDDKPSQEYRQNVLDKNNNVYKTDQDLLSIYSNYVESEQIRIENSTNEAIKVAQDFDNNDRKKPASSTRKTINSKGQKDAYGGSSDTIYIDDFDRPTYSSKSRGELGSIDYFDTILVDHKIVDSKMSSPSAVEKLTSVRMEEAAPSIVYKTRIISEETFATENGESKPRINNKRRWDKNKLMKLRKDDDVYDSEIETAGSGSGDFFDDTEVNEVFIKQLNSRPIKKEKSSRKSSKMNNLRRKKKHRMFIRVSDKFISSSPSFSTMSSGSAEDDIRSNWSYQRNFKRISSYPTNPTIHYSEPLSASGKKLLVPSVFNSNGASNSPTSPYNDNFQSQLELSEVGATSSGGVKNSESTSRDTTGGAASSSSSGGENNEAWIETRTRRIMGNVKKSEERSRQLLLCEEAGGGELCRMLFKGHIND